MSVYRESNWQAGWRQPTLKRNRQRQGAAFNPSAPARLSTDERAEINISVGGVWNEGERLGIQMECAEAELPAEQSLASERQGSGSTQTEDLAWGGCHSVCLFVSVFTFLYLTVCRWRLDILHVVVMGFNKARNMYLYDIHYITGRKNIYL